MIDTKALRELCDLATAANRFEPMSVRHYFTQSEFGYFRALRNAATELLDAYDERDALRERLRAAEESLRKLSNEVFALTAFERAVREVIGNTNYNVLLSRALAVKTKLDADGKK